MPSLSQYEEAWRMTEGRQFKKPQDVTTFLERIQNEDLQHALSSCAAAARAEHASAKSQVEQALQNIRTRIQGGGSNVAFWQNQLDLKSADRDRLCADDLDGDALNLSRSIEKVWTAYANAEEMTSETELLDIILDMEQGSAGVCSEFQQGQLQHKTLELQAVQAKRSAERESGVPAVTRGMEAHVQAQHLLAEACLINMIEQLREQAGEGEIADLVQDQLRLKMAELQELQARTVVTHHASVVPSTARPAYEGGEEEGVGRPGISYSRVQRMMAETLLLRMVLDCEEQGRNGGGSACMKKRKLWTERLLALQAEGEKELWNEQLQRMLKDAAAAANTFGEETWRLRVVDWLNQPDSAQGLLPLDEHTEEVAGNTEKRKRKARSSRPPLHDGPSSATVVKAKARRTRGPAPAGT